MKDMKLKVLNIKELEMEALNATMDDKWGFSFFSDLALLGQQ
jgi:hypothetical protein